MILDHPVTSVSGWSQEMRGAYLACAIDTDGWVGMAATFRHLAKGDRSPKITCHVGVTNQSRQFLERVIECAGIDCPIRVNGAVGVDTRSIVTRDPVWQIVWRATRDVASVLEVALPYLTAKQERAALVYEFVQGRISPTGEVHRSSRPYTARDIEVAQMVVAANRKSSKSAEILDEIAVEALCPTS